MYKHGYISLSGFFFYFPHVDINPHAMKPGTWLACMCIYLYLAAVNFNLLTDD